ncbi:hypothetical protein CYY_008233 [Polysphondylium violaceum]|uniref:Pterin-binding domain-containing protein n=1 Tax=Polysphondylium violaceum TaxID=133409 RepID=A0A8J4UXG5_9MYCE|nr:hypothetical protein CYY_008233 [Polysphondylium violaceum]
MNSNSNNSSQILNSDKIIIKDLHVQAVIGVNANERVIKQNIIITIKAFRDLTKCGSSDSVHDTISYSTLSKAIISYVESSHHYTLEALATGVAKICCLGFAIDRVKIVVQKPGAVKLAKWPGVQIERTLDYFKSNSFVEIPSSLNNSNNNNNTNNNNSNSQNNNKNNIVYLSIGSNLGDRYENLIECLKQLAKKCYVLSTSFIYETPAQYYLEQGPFFNIACKVSTDLLPMELLAFVKSIEKEMGRQETFRNGPRVIDIDIIYYNRMIMKTDTLEIPHEKMWERDFVLMPLNDIAPHFIHPSLHITTNQMKINLSSNSTKKMLRVGKVDWSLNEKTFIMGVLNVTSDSFYDGGKYNDEKRCLEQAKKLIESGADIIDIGAQSTYPGALQITPEQEIEFVVPLIKAIRKQFANVLLSIDTYNSSVAREAIKAGCNMINDVTGGFKDVQMLSVAKELRVPIILNHNQPTPQYLQQQQMVLDTTQQAPQNKATLKDIYFNNTLINNTDPSIINILNIFFKERVDTAMKMGLYRWQLILDPGLGFYKTYPQSIEILRRGKEIASLDFPILIGPSRKGFVGATIAKQDPLTDEIPKANSDRRLYGTVACCCIAAAWGVNIIRIHDVPEIRDSILISDSIYKN